MERACVQQRPSPIHRSPGQINLTTSRATYVVKKIVRDVGNAQFPVLTRSNYAEWEEVVTANDGGAAEHHIGRCILNWEKIDGEWKVVSEYINYLEPPTELAVSVE